MSSHNPTPPPPVPAPRTEGESHVLALLLAHIPLSLLLDLAGNDPHSEELYALERSAS